MTKVKVCCIKNLAEANLALQYGASALGLVSEMPSGPGEIAEDEIKKIIAQIPPSVLSFLLSSKTTSDRLIEQLEFTKANTIQLVDYVHEDVYKDLRTYNTLLNIVQVIHVLDESDIDKAVEAAHWVDYILLDSGNPNSKIKTLGGTGLTHNWDLSKRIVQEVGVPVFLAGGLNSGNANKAIEYVNPYGLDLCSGIRTNGNLSETKLKAFMDEVL